MTGFGSFGFYGVFCGRHISFGASSSDSFLLLFGVAHPLGPGPFGLKFWGHPSSGHPSGLVFLLVYFVCIFFPSFRLWCAMPVDQQRTVVIHAHGMVAAKSSNVVAQMLSKKLHFSKVRHVQFIPGGRIRVTFASVEYRNETLYRKTIQIDDVHVLNVTASDSPVTNVFVHYLPVEAGDVELCLALLPFGTVHEVTYQRFAGFKDISTGTRIVRMSLDHHIPFQCNIQGYPCRVWYAGQPLKCTICKGAHKAADCPDRNKCRRCHQPGHFAKDCKNAWGTTPQTPAPSGPPPPSNVPHPAPSSAPATPAPDAPCSLPLYFRGPRCTLSGPCCSSAPFFDVFGDLTPTDFRPS